MDCTTLSFQLVDLLVGNEKGITLWGKFLAIANNIPKYYSIGKSVARMTNQVIKTDINHHSSPLKSQMEN